MPAKDTGASTPPMVAVGRPIVKVVQERDMLKEFPGRIAGDLYLWVLDHQQFLFDHGKDLSPPEEAAHEYLQRWERSPQL